MRYQVERAHPVALQEAEYDLEDDHFEDGYNDALPEGVAYLLGIERVVTIISYYYKNVLLPVAHGEAADKDEGDEGHQRDV